MAPEKTPKPQRSLRMRPTDRISMQTTPAIDLLPPTDKGGVILRVNPQKKNPASIHEKGPKLRVPTQETTEIAGIGNHPEDPIQHLRWTETGIRIVLPETIILNSKDLTKDRAHQTTAIVPTTTVHRPDPATVVHTTPETAVAVAADPPRVAAAVVVADLHLHQEEVDKL